MDVKEDPLAAFRGKRFELTPFERAASKAEIRRIEKAKADLEEAQKRFFEDVRIQVLTRAGLPEERLGEVKVFIGVSPEGFPQYIEVPEAPKPAPEPTPEPVAFKVLGGGRR